MSAPSSPGRRETLLEAHGVSLGYGQRTVLANVHLRIGDGDFWFVVGPNGSGKTTLLRAVLGLLAPGGGRIDRHPELAGRRRIGFVPQRPSQTATLPTTVREFVSLGLVGAVPSAEPDRRRLERALSQVGLAGRERDDLGALSGGHRQRAALARALVRHPRFLILDEPTNGLDAAAEESFLDLLARMHREDGVTILIVTHDLAVALRDATHVALVAHGTVTAGARAEVLTAEHLSSAYGLPFRIEAGGSAMVVAAKEDPR